MKKTMTYSITQNPLLIGTLTLGVVIPLGMLSFWGTMLIYPSTTLAWLAFFLNGFVDGEVYLDNIRGGLKDPKFMGEHGYRTLIIKALNDYFKKNQPQTELEKTYVQSLEAVQQGRATEITLRLISNIQNGFVTTILTKKDHPHFDTKTNEHINSLLPTITFKVWCLRIGLLVSTLTGIGFAFVTADALAAVASASFMPFTWPLAITACIGYSILSFHNMKRIIFSETFDKWKNLFREWFTRKPNESLFTFSLRALSALILTTAATVLALIATLTAGYTWWIAIEKPWIRKILVPISVFSNLLLAEKNSLDSVKEIQQGINDFLHKPQSETLGSIKNLFQNENVLQILNPFRLLDKAITVTFDYLLLTAHSLAVAATGDRVPGYALLCLIAGAIADFFIDKSYMGNHDHDHHHAHHENKSASPDQEDDDRHHHTIPHFMHKYLVGPALFPLRLIAIATNALLSQFNDGKVKPKLSLKQAYASYFDSQDEHDHHEHCDHHHSKSSTHHDVLRTTQTEPTPKDEPKKHRRSTAHCKPRNGRILNLFYDPAENTTASKPQHASTAKQNLDSHRTQHIASNARVC